MSQNRDITLETEISCLYVRTNYSVTNTHRIIMKHKNTVVGVLKSKGWDLKPGYSIEYFPHPIVTTDDSWFKVYLKEE